jgi:hypothetical protein
METLHFKAVRREQGRVLFFGVLRVRVPAEDGGQRFQFGKQALRKRDLFRVLWIGREIVEEHLLANAPVGHAGHTSRPGVSAHKHDRFMRAAGPVTVDGVSVDLRVSLTGVTTAKIVDLLQAMFLNQRNKRGRDDERVFETGNRKRNVHRRTDGRIPHDVAPGVTDKTGKRVFGGFDFGEVDAVFALVKLEQRTCNLPLVVGWVNDVELRRGAIGQALKAEQHDFLGQAAIDAPVEIPVHHKSGARSDGGG